MCWGGTLLYLAFLLFSTAAFFVFSLYGFLLSPKWLEALLGLSEEELYWANVAVGWLSPLNHAAYHMHNFGYDLLPRLWQSCLPAAERS
ncbi:MAG: hypothetical protein LUF81_07275 [Clostridiales bacterium]|nr:hypothetical protein [Clostridiales bacterium]